MKTVKVSCVSAYGLSLALCARVYALLMFYDSIPCFPLEGSLYGRVLSSTWPPPEPGCVSGFQQQPQSEPGALQSRYMCRRHFIPQ